MSGYAAKSAPIRIKQASRSDFPSFNPAFPYRNEAKRNQLPSPDSDGGDKKSGREDLNLRPHDPQSCALAKLRHAPQKSHYNDKMGEYKCFIMNIRNPGNECNLRDGTDFF